MKIKKEMYMENDLIENNRKLFLELVAIKEKLRVAKLGLTNILGINDSTGIAKLTLEEIGVDVKHLE